MKKIVIIWITVSTLASCILDSAYGTIINGDFLNKPIAITSVNFHPIGSDTMGDNTAPIRPVCFIMTNPEEDDKIWPTFGQAIFSNGEPMTIIDCPELI